MCLQLVQQVRDLLGRHDPEAAVALLGDLVVGVPQTLPGVAFEREGSASGTRASSPSLRNIMPRFVYRSRDCASIW